MELEITTGIVHPHPKLGPQFTTLFDNFTRKGRVPTREETSSSGSHAMVLEQGKWKQKYRSNKKSHLTVSST